MRGTCTESLQLHNPRATQCLKKNSIGKIAKVRVGSYYTSCNGNPNPNPNANTNLSASCDGTRRRLLLAAFLFT